MKDEKKSIKKCYAVYIQFINSNKYGLLNSSKKSIGY